MTIIQTVKTNDIIGRAEAAEILGVSPQQINNLLARKAAFPRPIAHPRSGMIFSRSQIVTWARNDGRDVE